MEIQKVISTNITFFRGEMSRKALAQKSGVSYKHIYDIEEGLRSPSVELLEKLAKALSVSVTDLLQEEKPNVIPLKPSQVVKMFSSVPDNVYELAEKYGPDHGIWKIVVGVLESHLDQLEKENKKGKAN